MSLAELSVIKALKIGKVPMSGCTKLAVGRDGEIAEFGRVLDYVEKGGAETRFLRGDYGSGKTFMCSVVRELAFSRHFVVSVVNLTKEVPFGRRELVLTEIIRGLRTPSSGTDCAFGEIVDTWLSNFDPGIPLGENKALQEAIHAVATGDPQLAMGLRGYYNAYLEGNDVLMEGALSWLRGEAITQEVRSGIKVVGKVTPDTAFKRLRGLIALMNQAGFPGLVILLDEAESIMKLMGPQRTAAYTAIRELIDTCEVDFPHCFFLFAGTAPMFEDEFRGVASYQALYQRIRSNQVSSTRDLRQPIVRLEELDGTALQAVSRRVRDMHGVAYGWDSTSGFPDEDIDHFIASAGSRFGELRQKPRGYLKSLVDVLDARQQGFDVNDNGATPDIHAIEGVDAGLEDVVLVVV